MVAIDTAGRIAAGTSTNGAKFKIPGWVIWCSVEQTVSMWTKYSSFFPNCVI
jgi:hypothetical protein